ncbi:MAG: hypothetical protein JWM51_1395 [Microbacteriaceae bacterium]|nr:hypothetical protein [Microbacteriaceae bacterium]
MREAFDRPTLRLLDRKWAPFVLAVFRSAFSRDRRNVSADRLHTQVDAYLADLRSVGVDVPKASGRALCVQWMNDQWLYREAGEGDDEKYTLTSHTLEALVLVESLSRDRALISESRLTTIVDTVRQRATQASPDREERVRRLDLQIAQMTGERDRLASGGEIAAASNAQMHEGYANLIDLIGQLPSDFKRVEESVAGMHRQIVNDFRGEERPISEVLDEYLAKTDTLMSSTAEGRAFEGAFALLRDDDLLAELKNDLETILLHPFALELTASERRGFMATVSLIRKGIDDVLTQRNGLTTTLREHIVNHDVVKDRELERLLRDINKELATWMETAGPRSVVTAPLLPATVDIEHLREKFYDPNQHTPPPPLDDVSQHAPEPPSLDEMRRQGGPQLGEMRDALTGALGARRGASIGDAFNELDATMRRPVEILGLLQIATQVDAIARSDTAGTGDGVARSDALERFETIRPDGTRRDFVVPRIILNDDERAAMRALNYGADDE